MGIGSESLAPLILSQTPQKINNKIRGSRELAKRFSFTPCPFFAYRFLIVWLVAYSLTFDRNSR
jgi:hypothetical protein